MLRLLQLAPVLKQMGANFAQKRMGMCGFLDGYFERFAKKCIMNVRL